MITIKITIRIKIIIWLIKIYKIKIIKIINKITFKIISRIKIVKMNNRIIFRMINKIVKIYKLIIMFNRINDYITNIFIYFLNYYN